MKFFKAMVASIALVFCFGMFGACDWFNKEYDVTFMNGTATLGTYKVKKGEKATVPKDPSSATSTQAFSFWSTEKDITKATAFDFNTEIKQNTTLYAMFGLSSLTASNGSKTSAQIYNGDSKLTEQQIELGDLLDTSTAALKIPEGKILAGLYLDSKFTIPFDFSAQIFDPDIKIYVKLVDSADAATYKTVTFKDGETVLSTQKVEVNGTVVELAAPVKTGYIFEGWFNGSTEFVFQGEENATKVTSDIELTARYTEDKSSEEFLIVEKTLAGLTTKGLNAYELSVPDTVEKITKNAFKGAYNLVKLTIPSSVTEIEKGAFDSCYALVDVVDNSKKLSKTDFRNPKCKIGRTDSCIDTSEYESKGVIYYKDDKAKIALVADKSKESVTLDSKTTEIGSFCFYGSKITSITIPASVINIGLDAFYNCKQLTSITFSGANLETIENFAFANCTSLSTFDITNKVYKIGIYAFKNTGLTSITGQTTGWKIKKTPAENYTLDKDSIKTNAYVIERSEAKQAIIPANVLPEKANTVSVKFMQDVNTTFWSLPSLAINSSLQKPASTPVRAGYTFAGWFDNETGGTQHFVNSNSEQVSQNTVLYAHWTKAESNSDDFEIVDGKLKSSSYSICIKETVTVPSGVKRIGAAAFSNSISKFKKVVISDDVEIIENGALDRCYEVEVVELGKNVKEISAKCFYYCEKLKEFKVSSENKNLVAIDGVLYAKNSAGNPTKLICFPPKNTAAVKGDDKKYTIPSTVTEIGDYAAAALYGAGAVTSIEKLDLSSVTKIGTYAFASSAVDGNNISSVTFGSGLKEIGSYSFNGCEKLTSISLPSSLEVIGSHAFVGCKNLSGAIVIPSNVKYIGRCAFFTVSGGNPDTTQTKLTSIKFASATGWKMYEESMWYGGGSKLNQKNIWNFTDQGASASDFTVSNGVATVKTDVNYLRYFSPTLQQYADQQYFKVTNVVWQKQ